MLPSEYTTQDCSIARSLELIGERWTLLVIRSALLGRTTFNGFMADLGIATSTLTRRLDGLVDNGLMEVRTDPVDHRKNRYELTEAGRSLWVTVETIREWGDDLHLDSEPPLTMSHRGCGGATRATVVCATCDEPLGPDQLEIVRHRPVRRPS